MTSSGLLLVVVLKVATSKGVFEIKLFIGVNPLFIFFMILLACRTEEVTMMMNPRNYRMRIWGQPC